MNTQSQADERDTKTQRHAETLAFFLPFVMSCTVHQHTQKRKVKVMKHLVIYEPCQTQDNINGQFLSV